MTTAALRAIEGEAGGRDAEVDRLAIEAEQSCVGALLNDAGLIGADWMPAPSDFHDPDHVAIVLAVAACEARGAVDLLAVAEELRRRGVESITRVQLIALAESVPSRALTKTHARLVRERAQARRSAAVRRRAAQLLTSTGAADEVLPDVDALLEELRGAPARAGRFPLLEARQVADMPTVQWLVKGVIPQAGLGSIYGPSTSGKSFLTLDLLAASVEGREWFGRRSRPARWIYIALEGQSGVPQRVRAWEEANRRPFPPGVRFLFERFRLVDPLDVMGLAAAIKAAGGADGVVIDTLNRSAPGADENSSADMGSLLDGAAELQAVLGCVLMFIAHTGKDAGRGLRGHSSIFAALDFAIETSNDNGRREWKLEKAKDGRDGDAFPYSLRVVDLGDDEDGDPVTSCVVERESEEGGRVAAIAAQLHGERADEVCVAGYRSLVAMGVHPVDGKTSGDYLPSQILAKGLATGFTKEELGAAMNRLMGRGVFVRGVIGKYSNRSDKLGLLLSGEASRCSN